MAIGRRGCVVLPASSSCPNSCVVHPFKWWSFSHARPHFTSQLSSIAIFLGLVSWNTVVLGVGQELGANGWSLVIGD